MGFGSSSGGVPWMAVWNLAEEVQRLKETVRELHHAVTHKPTQEELQASFAKQLERGGYVTRDDVAAWHRITLRQLSRDLARGKLQKLPGYGRKAMFDSRVACRYRPTRKEG